MKLFIGKEEIICKNEGFVGFCWLSCDVMLLIGFIIVCF